jgi:3,4-dihydroxy 2-butanone 4-phosphate synthase/GTP cyclohydrolase II
MTSCFISVEKAIELVKAGQMIILTDDESRENEGDLVVAAEFATADVINFMTRFARGLICLPMHHELVDALNLPLMSTQNRSPFGTAFTISIEAAVGVTTGISAKDRAQTVQAAIKPGATSQDIISPGHIFPLRARSGGVLERAGQTEGSVDLAKLAGLTPASVICEIMNEDGTMSRQKDLIAFSEAHNIPILTIRDLIEYRIRTENLVQVEATSTIPIPKLGDFEMTVFSNQLDDAEHFALVKPPRVSNQLPLVRLHSECITGDVFGSCKCDCGAQLQRSLDLLAEEGGILLYLRQEGRGIGLANKLKAYALQEAGYDTVDANLKLGLPADNRDYAVAYQILRFLGINALRLLTNNPQKVASLEKYGLNIVERIPLTIKPSETNRDYLKTKQVKLGHLLTLE